MKIINETPFQTEAMPLMGPDGNMLLVVIVKGTFQIPSNQKASPLKEQIPIFYTDEYTDPKKISSVKYESDLVPTKPKTDVVLMGTAYAPNEKPLQKLSVRLRINTMEKVLHITGDRFWEFNGAFLPVTQSTPAFFRSMPLTFERAFGGSDPSHLGVNLENPVGSGFILKKGKAINGISLPNIEDPRYPIKSWKDRPQPAGFGFLSKTWKQRLSLFGRCDETWLNERMPAPPKDFKPAYYNSSPLDQQINGCIKGGETIELTHLTPEGNNTFFLPDLCIQSVITQKKGRPSKEGQLLQTEQNHKIHMQQDTLCLLPDGEKYYTVWRGTFPIEDPYAENISGVTIKMSE